MREALLYEKGDGGRVTCRLCAHQCILGIGKTGLCNVRINEGGLLMTMVYGRTISANVDPIEKKPLFHFLPGSRSMSVAAVGCNLTCAHCQNHEISQMPRDHGRIAGRETSPEEIVNMAISSGAASISYTYTEPTIYFEYALDTARLATKRGLRNVFVTNGYMSEKALETIGNDLHAANVDLKAFSDDFYKKICGARLEPVKKTIARMKKAGVWVEVTTLLIPGYNDDEAELKDMAEWLVSIGPDIPWHLSRFHPTYRLLDAPVTPKETIDQAMEIGRAAGLHYVYSGNVRGDRGESTYCHECGELLIGRFGFNVTENLLDNGVCPGCQSPAAGIWS